MQAGQKVKIMQIHQLRPKHKLKKKKRIGRGGKKGTYSGHGVKGQRSRAGRKLKPIIRVLIKRYPKLRGYRNTSKKKELVIVNIGILEERIELGEVITPESLIKKGIIHKIKGRVPEVKILGKGKLSKKLVVEDCEVSKGAREKIEKLGGTIKEQRTENREQKKS